MKAWTKRSTVMTVTQFDNGYWYATEIKAFAKTIGIPSVNKLRKDELEPRKATIRTVAYAARVGERALSMRPAMPQPEGYIQRPRNMRGS